MESKLNNSHIIEDRKEYMFFRGERKSFPVYRVRISELYYNDQNGRIASFISDYNSTHEEPISKLNFDEYNNIIESYIKESCSSTKFNHTKNDIRENGQAKVGIILDDGRVIDGNRRFTILRDLYSETGSAKYEYFECFMISSSTDPKDIKDLELRYQFGEDEKEDYNPIDRLVDYYFNLCVPNAMYTPEQYSKITNEKYSVAELKKGMKKARIMVDYLEYIGKPMEFHYAREAKLDGLLQELSNNIVSNNDYESRKQVLFSMLNNVIAKAENGSSDRTRDLRQMLKTIGTDSFEDFSREVRQNITSVHLNEKYKNLTKSEKVKVVDKLNNTAIHKLEEKVEETKLNSAQSKPLNDLKDICKKIRNVDIVAAHMMSDKMKAEALKVLSEINTVFDSLKRELE